MRLINTPCNSLGRSRIEEYGGNRPLGRVPRISLDVWPMLHKPMDSLLPVMPSSVPATFIVPISHSQERLEYPQQGYEIPDRNSSKEIETKTECAGKAHSEAGKKSDPRASQRQHDIPPSRHRAAPVGDVPVDIVVPSEATPAPQVTVLPSPTQRVQVGRCSI